MTPKAVIKKIIAVLALLSLDHSLWEKPVLAAHFVTVRGTERQGVYRTGVRGIDKPGVLELTPKQRPKCGVSSFAP